MKNIIITFHKELNYGAILQCFALAKVLEIKGETEILNYDFHKISDYSFMDIIRFLTPNSIIKKIRFHLFLIKQMKLSSNVKTCDDVARVCNHFDNIICGSDQIWAFDITQNSKDIFLANFEVKNTNILSYAASIGKDSISINDRNYLVNSLKKYNMVSVREESAKKILGNDIQTMVVLDPTLLLSMKDWEELLKLKNNKKKYILVYMLEHDSELIKFTKQLSNKLNLKIYCFNNINRFGKNCSTFPSAGPLEFVNLFKNATYVVTNSYHGLCFSINFEKQFVCFLHNSKSTRQENLLDLLKLKKRVYNKEQSLDYYCNNQIDYKNVNLILNEKRKESLNYLYKALRR